jgi:rod shape-determining protein MreC
LRLTDPRIPLPLAPSRRAKAVLAGTLAGCLLLMSAQVREGDRGASLLERTGLGLLTPLVEASRAGARGERSLVEGIRSYFFARSENEKLRGEIGALQREALVLRAEASDADRLRQLLRGQSFLPSVRLAAPLVSVERRGGYRRALLAAGSSDGVAPDAPLAVPEGLVGRVVSVSPHLSKAILVTDEDCAVGARVGRTGEQGVVRGAGNELRMEYLSTLSPVAVGDFVETAGIDGIFPRGIPIGRVRQVSRGKSLFLTVRIAPAAPLSRLSDVLILAPSPVSDARP